MVNKNYGYRAYTILDAVDVLARIFEAVSYAGLHNSATGAEPKDTFGHIIEWIQSNLVNPAISVANFIYHGLVAVGDLIAHAAEVVAQFAMKLWNTVKSTVKAAVEIIKKVVDAVVEWVKSMAAKAFSGVINAIKAGMSGLESIFRAVTESIYSAVYKGEINNNGILKIEDFMSSPMMQVLSTLPMIVLGLYGVITAASMGISAIVMSLLQGYIVQVIINAIVGSLQQLHITIPSLTSVFNIPADFIKLVIGVKSLNRVNGMVTAIGFGATMIGTMVGYYLFKGPIGDYKELLNLLKVLHNALDGIENVPICSDEAISRLNTAENTLARMRNILGKYGADADTILKTPISDLKKSIWTSGRLLIVGVASLGVALFSLYLTLNHMDNKYQAFASGLAAGLGLYTFYASLKNKLVLPGAYELMDKIGFGATVIFILSSGAQMGYLLATDNGGS